MDAHYQFLKSKYDIWTKEDYNHCKTEGKFSLCIGIFFIHLKYSGESTAKEHIKLN